MYNDDGPITDVVIILVTVSMVLLCLNGALA
jgi:hypothetical protein